MNTRVRASQYSMYSIMVLVLAVAVATAGAGSRALAQAERVTVEQLAEALLTPDDLGPGFIADDGSTRLDPPSVVRALGLLTADNEPGPGSEYLIVGLVADPTVDPATVVDALLQSVRVTEERLQVTITDLPAADWLATEAVSYEGTEVIDELILHARIYAWRQGPVVAVLMSIIATSSSKQASRTASRYAELQRDKLSAICAPCIP